ncbi:MAG: translation initiation factor IF-2 [Euryarchaeota archaeon RBG_16_68_13]|nr:MAG: translation initiation factor IF-2 [Euryarchaeota archaeon RBG_16_68_13]
MPAIRQPIVSVLGHVDHGKTTVLDRIRGTGVAGREAGGITQHIGATEVPLAAILETCGDLVKGKSFKIPGLLFIDTPGHVAFSTLRARGGALADLAILVVDLNEGFRPQTIESIGILKRFKTPFLVAANKIDLVPGWRHHDGKAFIVSYPDQPPSAAEEFDRRLYGLVGKFYEHGFSADRYDKVTDFTTSLAIVPLSAKFGEGLPDLLLMLVGLSQRFLEADLVTEEGPAEATILEVKEEKGLGVTLDAIVYKGTLRRGDPIVFGTTGKPGTTKVKALLKPKPLDEIRDPQDRFDSVKEVSAAAGVKISASGLEGAVAGAPVRAARGRLQAVIEEVAKETAVHVETQDEGVLLKADAIGSLEGLAYECKQAGISVKSARIGPLSRRDIVDMATVRDPLHQAILAFNVELLPDAKTAILEHPDLKVLQNDVIYRLIEDYGTWRDERKRQLEEAKRKAVSYPAKLLFLADYVFRVSKPAIFGVRVLAGRIRTGQAVMRDDGRPLGRVRSLRSGEESLAQANQGQEVAIAIDGITVGRQISGGDVLLVDLPEADARALRDDPGLTHDEREALDQICAIKRKEDPFWGM